MIYLPKRAVFIHVPRTGGNSITNAIASACAGNEIDIVVSTHTFAFEKQWENFYTLNRHIPARFLSTRIAEWDKIFKFAVYRPEEERLASLKRLIRRDKANNTHLSDFCGEEWKSILTDPVIEANIMSIWREETIDFFTKGDNGEDLGIEIYNFNELHEKWPEICDKCKIPRCNLPHLNGT